MKTKTIIFFNDPNVLHHNVNTFSDMAHHLLSAAGVSFTSRIKNTKHLILFLDPGEEQVSGNVTAVEARDFLNKLIARDQGVIYIYIYKESPRGAASGLSMCNFSRLQASLLSLFLVQMS